MAEDILRMRMKDVKRMVAGLEEKYRTWTVVGPSPQVTLDDLAQIRASLQRSIAALDRLLVDWDQATGRQRHTPTL